MSYVKYTVTLCFRFHMSHVTSVVTNIVIIVVVAAACVISALTLFMLFYHVYIIVHYVVRKHFRITMNASLLNETWDCLKVDCQSSSVNNNLELWCVTWIILTMMTFLCFYIILDMCINVYMHTHINPVKAECLSSYS